MMDRFKEFLYVHQAGLVTAAVLLVVVAAGIYLAIYWLGGAQ
jgi:hypothetical protein